MSEHLDFRAEPFTAGVTQVWCHDWREWCAVVRDPHTGVFRCNGCGADVSVRIADVPTDYR